MFETQHIQENCLNSSENHKTKVMNEFVIRHPEDGIYLGNFMGLGFWSLLDPAGQDAAVTFPCEKAAQDHIHSWESDADSQLHIISKLKIVPVAVAESGYATIKECEAAGLPGWNANAIARA